MLIYNVWIDFFKYDYIEVLVEVRKLLGRYFCVLIIMMIECSYYGWESFFKVLDVEVKSRIYIKEVFMG